MSNTDPNGFSEHLLLALTVWGEARGEGLTGMAAVACVIRNRATHPRVRWWGTGFRGVILHPFQFSCWNDRDPNRRLLLSVAQLGSQDSSWTIARAVANEVLSGRFPDITRGADHYHADYVTPNWANPEKRVATFGRHIFYKHH